MNRTVFLSILAVLLLSGACASNWGTFKKLSMEKPENVTVVKDSVSGSDCTAFRYWHANNIAEAARDALSQAPGAVALTNVRVSFGWYPFVQCLHVEGTAVK